MPPELQRGRGAGRAGCSLPALLGVALLAVTACGTAVEGSVDPTGAVTVVVVGDSITQMNSPDFDNGHIGTRSWAAFADGDGIKILGGWAHAGATTADMLAGLSTRSLAADVVVIMAGNNDIDHHAPVPAIEAGLERIALKVHARRVVLSTVAPEDAMGLAVNALNAQLPAFAWAQGWDMIDPMRPISDGHGHYLAGMTRDGVHPSPPAARIIGEILHRALVS